MVVMYRGCSEYLLILQAGVLLRRHLLLPRCSEHLACGVNYEYLEFVVAVTDVDLGLDILGLEAGSLLKVL